MKSKVNRNKATLAFVLVIAVITIILAFVAIWTQDERWAQTAVVVGFIAAVPGLVWLVRYDS